MKKILLSFLVIVVLIIPNNYVIALKNGIETKVTEEKTPVSVEQVTNVQSLKSGYGADPVLYLSLIHIYVLIQHIVYMILDV